MPIHLSNKVSRSNVSIALPEEELHQVFGLVALLLAFPAELRHCLPNHTVQQWGCVYDLKSWPKTLD